MSRRRSKSKDILRVEITPPWKIQKGHQEHMGGSGVHTDRRLRRQKTRQAQRKKWQDD